MLQHQRTLHRKELVIVNNRRHYTTGPWRKKDIVLTQIALGLFGIFMGVMIFAIMVLLWSPACAEELPTYKCWAFCEPGSEVLIRERPGKRAPVVGAAGSGEQLRTGRAGHHVLRTGYRGHPHKHRHRRLLPGQ